MQEGTTVVQVLYVIFGETPSTGFLMVRQSSAVLTQVTVFRQNFRYQENAFTFSLGFTKRCSVSSLRGCANCKFQAVVLGCRCGLGRALA